MNILHVVPTFYPAVRYGGPIYSVLNLCLHLGKLGCHVKVLTTDANGSERLTEQQQRDPGLNEMCVQFCRRIAGTAAPGLVTRLPGLVAWADVIHLTAVYNFPTLPTLFQARRLGKPVVWSPRGTLQRWSGTRRTCEKAAFESLCRMTLPRSTVLHVTSSDEAAESQARFQTSSVAVIPNGIDIPALPARPQCDGALKILYIGRLDPKKGVENLLEALPILRGRINQWRLRIVGDGASKNGLRHKAAAILDLQEQSSIEFCGQLSGESKYHAFQWCDLVVVPSHTENFGIVVAESLAHARPVIASTGTPWQELVPRGCGFWESNSPAQLADAIMRMSQSDRHAMGMKGRSWMEAAFSWPQQAVKMRALYEQLVSGAVQTREISGSLAPFARS